MLIIGITGPSGSGKGAVSGYLNSKGFKIIDADAVYHGIVTPPSPCIYELVSVFGKGILLSDGNIDRRALAKLVFGPENREKLVILNKITHKYVINRMNEMLSDYIKSGAKACVIDAPLLIEAGIHNDCNFTIAVLAQKSTRIERIIERDGIDRQSAERRINSQKPDEFYKCNTDEVVYNDGDLASLYESVDSILQKRRIAI